jgi:hypothetical protein
MGADNILVISPRPVFQHELKPLASKDLALDNRVGSQAFSFFHDWQEFGVRNFGLAFI